MFSYLSEQPKDVKPTQQPKQVSSHGLFLMDWLYSNHSCMFNTVINLYVTIAKSNIFTPIVSISNCRDGGIY